MVGSPHLSARSLVVLASMLLATACSTSPTQLVVVVDTDLPIPARVDEISVTVSTDSGVVESERAVLSSPSPLPLTLGVSPATDFLGPVDVVARGVRSGTLVVERRARVTLVRGETRMLRLDLLADCAGVACREGESCGEAGCASIEIADLPPWPGSPPRIGDDAGVLDGGPRDAMPPDAAPDECEDDTPCDDGIFCNGFDRCQGGTCSAHTGDPCGAPTVCDESADLCRGCIVDADCPGEQVGDWQACVFADACAETGTRSRTVRSYACEDGACIATERVETEPCARSTAGDLCGETTCDAFGTCEFPSTCAEAGEQSRRCTERRCASGTCQAVTVTETVPCARITEGDSCGTTRCSVYSACDWRDVCDESASRSRTCTDRRCMAGECASVPRVESEACVRDTDGESCGASMRCRDGSCVLCWREGTGTWGNLGETGLKTVRGRSQSLELTDFNVTTIGEVTVFNVIFSGEVDATLCVWQVHGEGNHIRFVDWAGIDIGSIAVSGGVVSGSSAPPCVSSEFGCFPPCVQRVSVSGSTLRLEYGGGATGTLTFACP